MGQSVFISYRRDGGEVMAQLLHDRLVEKGFSVFYDIESLKSGPFDTKLFLEIEAADYVVLVLPPRGLDRCIYEEDWVRQEIRHALKHSKTIVPVMLRGFEFPYDLPDDIAAVTKCNGVRFDDMNYLDAKINKIIDLFDTGDAGISDNSHRRGGPAMISNVCSIGSINPNDPWPKGKYSPIVSLDIYKAIFFHCSLIRPITKNEQITVGYVIYDEKGSLAAEYESQINFEPGNDRFSIGWILRGEDGSYIRAGRYRAELWIGNSRAYEYQFMITSDVQASVRQDDSASKPQKVVQTETTPEILEKIKKLEIKMSRPWGFLYFIMIIIGYFLMRADSVFLTLGGLVCIIGGWIMLMKYTKKYIKDSWFIAFLLCYLCYPFYGMYLLYATIIYFINRDKWKVELRNLKALV